MTNDSHSSKIYLLDVGIVEDTVLYELVPKEVDRINGTLIDIQTMLDKNGARYIVMDSAYPEVVMELRCKVKSWHKVPMFGNKGMMNAPNPKYLPITGRLPSIKK